MDDKFYQLNRCAGAGGHFPTPAPSIMISPTVAINDPVDFASIVPISGRPVEVIIMAIIIEEMTASTISTPISDNIASATSGVNPSRPSSLPGRPWHHSDQHEQQQ